MTRHPQLLLIAIYFGLLLLTAGCGRADPTPTPTAEPTSTPTAEPTAPPTATPVPSPTATPVPPEIDLDYQLVEDRLTVERVIAPEDGWLVIYADNGGPLGADVALGYLPVEAGRQTDLAVPINGREIVARQLQVALHGGRDADAEEPDDLTAANLLLIVTAEIDTPATRPDLQISDQAVDDDGLVVVDRVYTAVPAWLAVYERDTDQLLGYAPLDAGETISVPVRIRRLETGPQMRVALLADEGEAEVFEPQEDLPIEVDDQPVGVDFRAFLPPEIVIMDQPIIDDTFLVQRVMSIGDGWLVVYEDEDGDGQPGFIIGTQAVSDGLSENVVVTVDGAAAGDQLLVTLHDDTGEEGVFDFPAADQPRTYQERAFFTIFSATAGSTLITADQPRSDEPIRVPLVVAVRDVWVTVVTNENGQPGTAVLGRTRVAAGVAENVMVPLDETPSTNQLFVVLRIDGGQIESFNPAEDIPLTQSGAVVAAPFTLLEETDDDE